MIKITTKADLVTSFTTQVEQHPAVIAVVYQEQQLNYAELNQRANQLAEWELRIGQFRVLYDVAETVQIVEIERIGQKKGNKFLFRGKEEDV